ncbi:MFS transporter [Paenibacillus lentus]|uniref:MFS transporter n=1 Tax=Paenibacillus lentus TaxID=1338368 RepID=A0A3Q8S648_9BACL|nr:MFS transporter [Paenibacillus lentus]AZK48210.1 MFS transporter [Paenibacillus lentus]
MKSSLDRQCVLLLAVNSLFVLAGALSGTFLSVYLWKAKQDFTMIGWFAFSQQIAIGLTFWIAGKWVKERDKMILLRLGIMISGIFYLLVLFVGTRMVHYIWPLGIVSGIGAGIFWLAFNVVYFEVTDKTNRDLFNGWVGIMGSVIGISGPWLSGWLISALPGEKGYRFIFTISLIVYGIGVLLSFWLKKRERGGEYLWLEPVRRLRAGSPWRQAVPASIAYGVREGVFLFLINLLVYISTSSEWKVGQYMLITSLVSLITYWAAGKWLAIRHRYMEMLVGAVMITLVVLPLLWKVSYTTLIIFGIGTSLFMPLYIIPMISSVFDLIGLDSKDAEYRVELIVLREISMMAGRLAGIAIFICFYSRSPHMTTILWLMAGLGAAPLVSWFAMRKLLVT